MSPIHWGYSSSWIGRRARGSSMFCVWGKKWLLCSCVISVNVVGTWHAWGHLWLLYHLDNGVVLAGKNIWYLVLPLIILNELVCFSPCCAYLNEKWWFMVWRHNRTWVDGNNFLESDGQTSKAVKDGAHTAPSLHVFGMTFTTLVGGGAILHWS